MNHYTPRQRARRRIALLRILALWGIAFLAVHLLDKPVYALIEAAGLGHDNKPRIEGEDWYEILRATGSLLTWALIAAAIVLHDRRTVLAKRAWLVYRRGVLIFASAVAGGLITEFGKMLTKRKRPGDNDGVYVFRPWLEDFFNTGGLGLPSSHAGVAFGGAAMLAMFMPGAGVIAMAAAVGCAISRLLTGAHWLTDVFLGALLAVWAARLIYRAFGPQRGANLAIADPRARLG